MFGAIIPNKKNSPSRHLLIISPTAPSAAPRPRLSGESVEENPSNMFPPSSGKIRHSKVKGVKAIKKHSSPPSRSLDVFLAAQNGVPQKPPENEAAAPRKGKRGYRPPDVRTIFEFSKKDPRVKEERGEGHTFSADESGAWCDVCCDFVFQDRLTCTGCKYTCHSRCRDRVSLDCHQNGLATDAPLSSGAPDHLNNNVQLPDVEKERELRTQLSKEEIGRKIELYNSSVRDHLKMTLNPNGVYTGFIKVQLELRRPITVRGGRVAGLGRGPGQEEAFYLPRGAVNTLHISSVNTAREVIEALLHKFTVADNPAKFALFKRCRREDQVYVCKLAEEEHPLFLRLVAGPNVDALSFVLQEQPTGEVIWDAFSIPELHNFLRILDKEEEEQLQLLTRRYVTYRQKLEEALRIAGNPG